MIATEHWQRVSDTEENILKQRSKLHWLQLEDCNNKFFHNATKMRETQNAIREIRCPSCLVVTSKKKIKKEGDFSLISYHMCHKIYGVKLLKRCNRLLAADVLMRRKLNL